jgi:hypothetical protein
MWKDYRLLKNIFVGDSAAAANFAITISSFDCIFYSIILVVLSTFVGLCGRKSGIAGRMGKMKIIKIKPRV